MDACSAVEVLGNAGDFLGGSATVVAAWYAFRQYRQWRHKKDAAAASAFLVALSKTCSTLETWARELDTTRPGTYVTDPKSMIGYATQAFERSQRDVWMQVRDLGDAGIEAAVHLPRIDSESFASEAARLYHGLVEEVDGWNVPLESPKTIKDHLETMARVSAEYANGIRALKSRALDAIGPTARGERA